MNHDYEVVNAYSVRQSAFPTVQELTDFFDVTHCPFAREYPPRGPVPALPLQKKIWLRSEDNEQWYQTRLAWMVKGLEFARVGHQRVLEDQKLLEDKLRHTILDLEKSNEELSERNRVLSTVSASRGDIISVLRGICLKGKPFILKSAVRKILALAK